MQVTKTTDDGGNVAYGIGYNNAATPTVTFAVDAAMYSELSQKKPSGRDVETGRRFSLFNTMPADVYAIRVYNAPLNSDEKNQNRLVDLLCYHGVELPGAVIRQLLDDPELLKSIASQAAKLTISEDETIKASNKANLETYLGIKNVLIQNDDSTTTALPFVGETVKLPDSLNGKTVVGYSVGEVAYAPCTNVTLESGTTLKPLVVDTPTTQRAVSVKVMNKTEDFALRFTASLVRSDFEAIVKLYGQENIRMGMLITPVKYVEMAGGVFTREALQKMVADSPSTSGAAFVTVHSSSFFSMDKETLTLAGSIRNFTDHTVSKNPAFTAIAFVDIYKEGVCVYTLYGSYDPNAKAAVKESMQKARPYMTDMQKGWIDSLISRFGG